MKRKIFYSCYSVSDEVSNFVGFIDIPSVKENGSYTRYINFSQIESFLLDMPFNFNGKEIYDEHQIVNGRYLFHSHHLGQCQ